MLALLNHVALAVNPTPSTTTTVPGANTSAGFPLLSLIVWLPLLGALVILLMPSRKEADWGRIRNTAIAFTFVPFFLSLIGLVLTWGQLGVGYSGGFEYEETINWLTIFGAKYHMGVDGISLPLVFLSTLLFFVATLASMNQKTRVKEYFFLLLVLDIGVTGVFTAMDLLLFFIFWEIELIPMFLLILIWGGPRRVYAAWKFLLFTIAASAFLLLAILVLYFKAGGTTFDMATLSQAKLAPALAGGPLLAVLPLLRHQAAGLAAPHLAPRRPRRGAHRGVGAAGRDPAEDGRLRDDPHLRRVLPRRRQVLQPGDPGPRRDRDPVGRVRRPGPGRHEAHGRLQLGLAHGLRAAGDVGAHPLALNGAVFQLFAHGVITGSLFLLVGLIYDRTHTRSIKELGGLAQRMPYLTVAWVIGVLASVGLPGFVGFVAEFEIFVGSFGVHKVGTLLAVFGVVLSAGYLLWMLERVFFGPLKEAWTKLKDPGPLELFYMFGMLAVVFLAGVLPVKLTQLIDYGVTPLTQRLGG